MYEVPEDGDVQFQVVFQICGQSHVVRALVSLELAQINNAVGVRRGKRTTVK